MTPEQEHTPMQGLADYLRSQARLYGLSPESRDTFRAWAAEVEQARAQMAQAAQPAEAWKCFHCGETFTDEDAAREHFGTSERQDPACTISIAPPARRPLTDAEQVLLSLLGAALGALRYHTEQTRPIQRTKETIAAIEHELARHGITAAKGEHP